MARRFNTNPSPNGRVHAAIVAAGIPIDGVSVSQHRIDFRPEATAQQQTQAYQIMDTFDFNAPPAEVATYNALLNDMSPAGFTALNGVQKLERLRAAVEWLLQESVGS